MGQASEDTIHVVNKDSIFGSKHNYYSAKLGIKTKGIFRVMTKDSHSLIHVRDTNQDSAGHINLLLLIKGHCPGQITRTFHCGLRKTLVAVGHLRFNLAGPLF
jgi:hypothetical protein